MSNPAIYDNRQRDGLASIQKYAKIICAVNTWANPILTLKYRANPAILALLVTLNELCAHIPAMDAAILSEGSSDPVIEDPTTVPGVDLGAPAPPAPPAP